MSDFGILLSVGSGQPFITPVSVPMSMKSKVVANSSSVSGGSQSAVISIPWDNTWPAMIFVRSNVAGTILGTSKKNGVLSASGANISGNAFTLTAYFFGIFPQSAPAWGLCVWDAAGNVVLSNETRVLSDLVTVGDPSIASQSGVGMDITLGGAYAVCPVIHGSTLFQNTNAGTGQPIIVNVEGRTSAAFNGSTTRFTAAPTQYPGGNPVGYTDTRCTLVAINTSAYD